MKPLFTIVTCFLFLTCSNSPTSIDTRPFNRVHLTFSSADTVEAQDLALWVSTQLVPSESEVTEMLYSINYLRYCFKDSIVFRSLLSERFLPPWTTTSLAVKFDSVTAVLVRNHTYSGWYLLPSRAKPDSVSPPDAMGWSLVSYSQHRNPWRLCDFYSNLPGVVYCEPNGIGFAGGTFPIFPGIRNGQMSYLFVDHNDLDVSGPQYFFYYENDAPMYAGIWSYQQNPRPSWWQEAMTSVDTFSYWGKYK
jgi:hypothetical protein